MAFFLFGNSRKKRTSIKKPPAAILRKCKKFKIKCTMKKGGKRVYRKTSILKKLISKKMRKMRKRNKKNRKVRRKVRFGFGFGSVKVSRKSRFGAAGDFSNSGPANYAYNQPVVQKPGILNQSSQIVTARTNDTRPTGLGLPGEYTPTYGVYRPFFGENVPTQVGPNWNFMGQPDGTAFAVGGPFNRYTAPASFGRRGRRVRRFGGGGCGSPLYTRDPVTGKCVYKTKKDLMQTASKKLKQAKKKVKDYLNDAPASFGRRVRRS